ncbi:POP5 [Candida pseudojiufengensis]|uniref:POP5 n=1 Tax=Candida pseudojiufengensis TaxID=497109 RepID=UPI0022254AFE|nr:POP5 [Candida pseudojiufengensis]KAI5966459.1 POP5 [Candida pseudojiufengensis]
MVRVKHRYILFEILYPPIQKNTSREEIEDYVTSEQNVLLTLHKSSPSNINYKTILHAIRKSLQENYGDIGSGSAGMLMTVKYFSNKTSTGIIRCGRSQFETIIGAMCMINNIDGLDVTLSCIHVSGTIKKCEEFSIKSTRRLIDKVGRSKVKDIDVFLRDISGLNEDQEEEVVIDE